MAARIAVLFLCIHGLVEVIGPMALIFNPQVQSSFEMQGLEGQQFEVNALILSIIGRIWGLTRFIAGWGVWSMKKWAVMLGIIMSAITMTAAISIIPAGVVDTILSAPVLVLLLYTWFGQDAIFSEDDSNED